MTPLPILLAAVFLGTGMCSFKIVQGRFFLEEPPRSIRALSRYCGSEVFMNTNKLKRSLDNLEFGRYL